MSKLQEIRYSLIGDEGTPLQGFDKAIALELPVKFVKWLQHSDNGDTHWNPHTREESASIGFSPLDCYMDETKTVEELYDYWINNIYKP